MRSEVMGKTLAMFMVIAMIATGIAMLPTGHSETPGAYTVTGYAYDDVTGKAIDGVLVTINNTGSTILKNITTGEEDLLDGQFKLLVAERDNYTLSFEEAGYLQAWNNITWDTFYDDGDANNQTADLGIKLMVPLPTVSGTVKELGAIPEIKISDVEVTIKGSTGGDITVETNDEGYFSSPVDADEVSIYYKINGYYDNNNLNVQVADYGDTSVGDVFLEKIVPIPSITVSGIVFEEGTTTRIPGALVSISEGEDKWITAVSDVNGQFEMKAYPGNYQIRASCEDYFTTFDENFFFTVPTDTSVRQDIELDKIDSIDRWFNGTISCTDAGDVTSATAYLYSSDGKYTSDDTVDGTGVYSIGFYASTGVTFSLVVMHEGYFTNVSHTGITVGALGQDVDLDPINPDNVLSGFVFDLEGKEFIEDATVTIYSTTYLYTDTTTTAENGYYEFDVNDTEDFVVVADAEGFQSEIRNNTDIDANGFLVIDLYPSKKDSIHTTYKFTDWNTILVETYKTMNVDNITARVEADRKWGMGPIGLDLNVGWKIVDDEKDNWETYLEQKGAEQRDTADFLTLDNLHYELSGNYSVTLEEAVGAIAAANSTIYVNSSYNYTLVGELEDAGADVFELVFNASYDNDYADYVYDITLPLDPKFEMTANVTETNNVEIIGYNNPININPVIFDEDSETITMTIERSRNGTAKASIVSGDHFHVLNSTFDNYTVIVAQGGSAGIDTEVSFSAAESTDIIGDLSKANFTWDFGDGTFAYGMDVTHNFTEVTGDVTVTLTINETGGNVTTRDILVKVDSQLPTAGISAITTDVNVTLTGTTLTAHEDMILVFNGVGFTDAEGTAANEVISGIGSTDEIVAGDGGLGIIESWFWSWGEEDSTDETITKDGSNNITHTYSEPGTYYINMVTTDVVGHESTAANWTVNILDTEAPMTNFNIIDSTGTAVTEVVENMYYFYNASATTDNYADFDSLSFEWQFDINGVITSFNTTVVNFTFEQVGDFNVTLIATDPAGNTANNTQLVHVNLGERANILMKVGSMVFDPSEGTAGSDVTISVNLTNDGELAASSIQVKFYIRNADGTDTEIGTHVIETLAAGADASASTVWNPSKKGDYTIWANATCADEHESQYWDNKIDDFNTQKITISEASWVLPAIIAGIVAVIVVVFFGFRYFMQSGTETDKSSEKRKKR